MHRILKTTNFKGFHFNGFFYNNKSEGILHNNKTEGLLHNNKIEGQNLFQIIIVTFRHFPLKQVSK